jgi:hypothetical protein
MVNRDLPAVGDDDPKSRWKKSRGLATKSEDLAGAEEETVPNREIHRRR